IINSFRELATSAVQAARAVSSVRPDLFAGWTMFFDSLREGRDRITGFGLAAAGTGRLIATAARGLMAAAPVIGAISLVLYEVIDALDLTGRKFEEAKEKAITNGAETMEELRKLQERNQEE